VLNQRTETLFPAEEIAHSCHNKHPEENQMNLMPEKKQF